MTQARLLGGRYQVGELLGYGGMAEVHRGRDLRLGRDVAIKMLRTDLARDDTFQLRFRREAQNAAALNHPAIVAVYDTGEERGSSGESLPYIVMEFVNGRTLKEVLQVEGRLMPRRALEITAEICSALEFSHRHGIIHRDIKPGNVMLTQTGQIKVMDFGIARALANSGATMTQTSAVIGTAQYLSPEQARGESVDARSDVYATGCVLYELVTGQPPFVGDSPVSVAYQHVREDARPPSLLNRDVTPPVDAVVLKALAKNPQNRYQSAAEMRADLLRAAQGRPVVAEPVMIDEHGAARARRPGPGGRPVGARTGPGQRRANSSWAVWGLIGLAVVAVITLVVGLIVAQQPSQAIVPKLEGDTKQQAELLLRSAGLRGEAKPEENPTCTLDQVLSQSPAPGTRVAENSVVTYTWCAGKGVATLPALLVNLPQEEVRKQLEELGFTVKEAVVEVDSAQPVGAVVRTEPPLGTEVSLDIEITLYVSLGNLKVVPPLRNYDEAAARQVLANNGFTAEPTILQRTVQNESDHGKVVDQNPAPGTEYKPTDSVTIYIGLYPQAEPSDTPSDPPTDPPGGDG